jgi:hypothetical protein
MIFMGVGFAHPHKNHHRLRTASILSVGVSWNAEDWQAFSSQYRIDAEP